jgi:small multidrug resistance pump
MIYWLSLGGAIVLEVAGTTSMKLSYGFTRPLPSVLLFVFYAMSFTLMTIAIKKIDMSGTRSGPASGPH